MVVVWLSSLVGGNTIIHLVKTILWYTVQCTQPYWIGEGRREWEAELLDQEKEDKMTFYALFSIYVQYIIQYSMYNVYTHMSKSVHVRELLSIGTAELYSTVYSKFKLSWNWKKTFLYLLTYWQHAKMYKTVIKLASWS